MVRGRLVPFVVAAVLVALGSATSGEQGAPLAQARSDASTESANSVPLDVAFRFDAEGLLSLADASQLPVAKDAVSAHWYTSRGWIVAVFEGLPAVGEGPLCIGASAIDGASGLVAFASYAPSVEGACDDHGAGAVPLAASVTGVRKCEGVVSFVTTIPAENSGSLFATIVTFPGDGTGIGVSGRLDRRGPLEEIDPTLVDCGPLPPERIPMPATRAPSPTPVITPAPPSQGTVAAEDRVPPPSPKPTSRCTPADRNGLQDVFRSPAGPYLVSHPSVTDDSTPTVVFLPGGSGSYGIAQRVWATVFAGGKDFDDFRIVIPYAVDSDLIDEAARVYEIVDEVLWCHGGDPRRVHLAGASNGGLAAYGLMARQPERFATLLGAPGAFPVRDPAAVDPQVWRDLLAGRAVFNGVGAFDAEWHAEVVATHNALAAAGIESIFAEFPAQGHVMAPGFDPSALRDFWLSH